MAKTGEADDEGVSDGPEVVVLAALDPHPRAGLILILTHLTPMPCHPIPSLDIYRSFPPFRGSIALSLHPSSILFNLTDPSVPETSESFFSSLTAFSFQPSYSINCLVCVRVLAVSTSFIPACTCHLYLFACLSVVSSAYVRTRARGLNEKPSHHLHASVFLVRSPLNTFFSSFRPGHSFCEPGRPLHAKVIYKLAFFDATFHHPRLGTA
ncbi:hypothetical protein LZ32DRAFT_83803 [Colletotrichum eremochloae]|nr:hypothetical protein LZ32DRAFT_83803 [Colletotrichum eremochloae]